MPVRTRRWNDPAFVDDGLRVLICRYRPRALPSAQETWEAWVPALGPSKELLAAYQGKSGEKLDWKTYRARYLKEMKGQTAAIEELAGRVRAGGTVTLLCAKACVDEARCHRTPLRHLIEKAVAR
jgi:uncharacterized protein YeaO (DUF488 family)